MKSRIFIVLAAFTAAVCGISCERKPPRPLLTPTEAEKKLTTLAKEEYGMTVVTRSFPNTLWIYIPLNTPFVDIKVSPDGPKNSSEFLRTRAINYLDVRFAENKFDVDYDVSMLKKYAQDPGYSSAYTEELQTKQHNILTVIYRSFGDFEKVPGQDELLQRVPGDLDFEHPRKELDHKTLVHAYVKTDRAPDFFVVVLADTNKGLEMQLTLYLGDLLRAYSDPLFGEEYNKRIIADAPTGSEAILGDMTGEHLNWHDLTWGEFLAKQVAYRIRFKYQRSDFKPTDDTEKEFLTALAETLEGYHYTDYQAIELRDLDAGKNLTLDPDQIKTFLPK